VYSNLLMQVGGISCDLAKVFDWVNHEILLAKLHFYGIQGVSKDWFRSYSTNRRQKVEVKSPNLIQNSFTGLGTMKNGVTQGSTLGSMLSIICMTDIPLRINSVSESI
jgi:hypothetical protein